MGNGPNYYYFLAGPGHVDVHYAFHEMGLFGNPYRQVLSFDLLDEKNQVINHDQIQSAGTLERFTRPVVLASPTKLVIRAISSPAIIRLGGYYEIEVVGPAKFFGKATGENVKRVDTSLVHPGGPLTGGPVSLLPGSVAGKIRVNLSAAFNGIGITSDGKPFTGGLDGVGYAYSGSLLAGNEFGTADQANVVSGTNSAIALPAGKYSALVVLATAVNGKQLSQPFKVVFNDGTSVTFTRSLSDWAFPAQYPGEGTALSMPYRNAANGTKNAGQYNVYRYAFRLNNSRTVSSVTLPANPNVKVFGMELNP